VELSERIRPRLCRADLEHPEAGQGTPLSSPGVRQALKSAVPPAVAELTRPRPALGP